MKNYKAAEVVYRKVSAKEIGHVSISTHVLLQAFEIDPTGATATEYGHFAHVLFDLGKVRNMLERSFHPF